MDKIDFLYFPDIFVYQHDYCARCGTLNLYGIYITIYHYFYADTQSVVEANLIVVYLSDLHPGANYK